MDLNDLDTTRAAETGFELELTHPTNASPLGMFVTVLGRDSDAYTKLQAAQNRKRIERLQKLGGRVTLSADELERDAIALLAACTRSWRRDTEESKGPKDTWLLEEEELVCSVANASKVYTRFKWIREQVDEAVVNRANFLTR